MNTNTNPVWSALDGFHTDLAWSDTPSAMRRLVASLAHSRAGMTPEGWKASCEEVGSHPALAHFYEDPYSRDARRKPAGYAGDARTLDYVYLRDAGAQPISPEGRALFQVSTGASIADAVRERSVLLAEAIASRASDRTFAVSSIACGHARELNGLSAAVRDRVRFWGIDQDARSIAYCQSHHVSDRTTFTTASVRDILTGRVRIPPSDVVYASGLFDYLDQRAAAALIRRMFASINLGGSVFVPNLTPQNEEIGYMEALMDWWMHYRSEADMAQLAAAASLDPAVAATTTYSTSSGRIAWLKVDRIGCKA